MVAILAMSKVIKLFYRNSSSSSKRSSTIYALTRALAIPVVTRLEHVANMLVTSRLQPKFYS
jgi:hypothetical protein